MYRLLSILLCSAVTANAQQDSIKNTLSFEMYAEGYYSYDFGKPLNNRKSSFLYSYNRYHQPAINLLMGRLNYTAKHFRTSFALAGGTYMDDNLAAENNLLGQVYEASAGIRLSKQKELWLDAGIFSSHIGFEGAIGADNLTLTRSLMADNSPYYESGFKLSYTSENKKWLMNLLCVNGWQRSIRLNESFRPAFGHQLMYKPNASLILNSSSFIGNDRPDSVKRMRYFHNLYAIWRMNEQLTMTGGFDIGWEQKNKKSSAMYSWYAPVVIVGYKFSDKHRLAARMEYYKDVNGIIISYPLPTGFKTAGYSLNYDYWLSTKSCFRFEARKFNSAQPIFMNQGKLESNNFFLTTSFSIRF